MHVRALVRPCPAAHAPRVPSRDARTMRWPRRSPSAYPRTCCGSSRCVFRSSVARVRGFPAIPKRAILFRGRRRRRGRADRARALARSPSRTRAPAITHAVLPSALPRAPSPPERHPTQLGISATHHLNRAPSRGSRTSARARRGFQARSSRGASPATRPRRVFSRFCARTSPPRSASSRRTRCYLPRACTASAAASPPPPSVDARGDVFFQCSARFAFSRKRFARARAPGAFCTTW